MQDTQATYFGKRESGIPLIGALPWGSHFCQFYEGQDDLLEILVPYVQAGLRNNEFCLWVMDDPPAVEETSRALRKVLPGFEEYTRGGQMEVLSRDQWRAGDGELGSAVVSRLDKALSGGFDGLRLVCQAPLQETSGASVRDAADALCQYNVIAVFTYPRALFDAVRLMAVVKDHRLALVKNAGRWEVIESSEAQSAQEALRRSEEKLHSVFANMSEGYAYHRIVLDARGEPCDYVFLEVNEAFERLTGLPRENLLGRRVTQALPGIQKDAVDWIGIYGKVALSGKPVQFENYSQALRKWYSVSAFSPHKGFFAVTFSDITERKATEQAMREVNERLQKQAEELQAQAEELHAQTEELNAQAEELRAVNEELQKSEQALRISEQRVRLKLDNILSPEGDLDNLELADIVDAQAIQSLMDDFHRLVRVPMAVIDLQGRVLVGVGWQTICTKFHRVHPETCRYCIESDTQLTVGVAPGECRLYKCKNHMWDVATPLMVAGQHVGNLFSGQFFFDDEPLEHELFRAQAQRYGFDEPDYLAALEAVPRLSRETLEAGMAFLMKLARMISQLSYGNLQLARSLGERDRLMESLRQGRERLNRAQEIAHLGSWELDLTCNELTWSDEVYRIFGLKPQEFGATYEAFLERVHPDDRAAVDAAYAGSLRENRDTYQIDHRVIRQDTGEIRIVHEKCEHFRDAWGHIVRSVGMVHDITERKQAQEQLLKLNRTLKALGKSSQALTRATDEAAYLQDVCKIIVEDCGHAMVWIGYAEQDEAKSVRPVAHAGFEEGYLETLQITWADTERGRGPTGTAIRTGQPALCRNMLTDPRFTPWREQAIKRGHASSLVLPLQAEGKVFGAITIYSREPDPFSEDEVALLMELAADLAYGITSLRLRAAHAQAEEALRESEARLRLALEGGGMGRWEWDVQRDSTFWDERVHELLGVDSQVPVASDLFFKVIDRRDRDAVRQLVGKALAGGEDFHAEFRVRRLNRDTPWLVSQGKVIRDERGQAVRLIGVMYDITQRKQMEADLRRLNDQLEEEVQAQTEELKDTVDRLQKEVDRRVLVEETLRQRSQMLEAFFQHTITPLAFMDCAFNFVRVNAAYAQADGKEPEFFAGKNHFALYPHEENQQIFAQVLQTKQPYFALARPFTYPDAPHRVTYWNWQLTPLLDEQGDVQFLVLNLEDVTERQKAFQELEHRARQLQKLTLELSQAEDRERKRLAEILHDDLQQQLAAAKFHLSLLGHRAPKDKAVQGAVEQLDQILRDAIEKSRSLSHELSPALLYQSDLGETFEWLARQLKTKHGLTVDVESRGRIDPSSEALKVFLFKTAQEILFNVVKHARVRAARLRIQRLRGGLWLTISDQGQGFDPGSLGKTGGFGLLSIRERIELLGGRMKIRSAAGRGTTFLIVVPDGRRPEDGRQTTEDGQPRLALSSVLRPSSSILRVLLVDDHKVMREGLAALLSEQADLEVVGQAGNGREAVDLACRLGPDVVVMDVAMPLMAGDEATRQIKLQLPRARVVALSMFEEADMAEAMRQAGAEAYLLKTAPSDDLLAAIRGRPSPQSGRA